MTNTPRAYRVEECREMFLDQVSNIYRYWLNIELPHGWDAKGQSETEYRMEGFLFSMFVIFDGGSTGVPGFDLVPVPHPEDREYLIEQGENWWPENQPINVDYSFHDSFNWQRLRK